MNIIMEFDKNVCPVLNVDGVMATGKQYDLEINLPEDNRTVIYGIIKDRFICKSSFCIYSKR